MTDKPDQTFVNPAATIDAAGRLGAIGQHFVEQWVDVALRIAGLHADAPWGGDDVGKTFVENYLPPAEDQGAGGVVKGIGSLGDALKELGPQVILAVNGSVATDEDSGNGMKPV
jgi:hypothetical protein